MDMADRVLGAAIFGAGWVAGEHAKAYQDVPAHEAGRRRQPEGGVGEEVRRVRRRARCVHHDRIRSAARSSRCGHHLHHHAAGFHPELTIRAAKAEKHVCIEKPIALDWKSCLEMQKAVQARQA